MRVLIADDHSRIREALREDLERGGLEICAEVETAAEAISAARRERPEVCLLDVHMPGDGIAAARAIRQALPAAKVILITATPDEEGALAAASAGAHGYLAKDVNPRRLPEIVRAVAGGEAAYPRSLLGAMLRRLTQQQLAALRGLSGQIAVVGCGLASQVPSLTRTTGSGGTMRLVLCDDNLILDEALAPALTACGHQVVAITTSPAAGVTAVSAHQPDVCLLDPRTSGEPDGLAAVRAIRSGQPDTAVVILTSTPDPSVAGEARRLGVAGFLGKDQNVAQIIRALDIVASGGTVFESALPGHARATAPQQSEPPYDLTPRETEVLRRIVAGQGTEQMANEMNIAASTLRTYVKNLLSKLGTHSRLQAAALASREGLVAELSA